VHRSQVELSEGVLDLLARLLDVAGDLVLLAFRFQLLVVSHLPGGFLHVTLGFLGGVSRLVPHLTHTGSSPRSPDRGYPPKSRANLVHLREHATRTHNPCPDEPERGSAPQRWAGTEGHCAQAEPPPYHRQCT